MESSRLRKVSLYEFIPDKPISDILGKSTIKLRTLDDKEYTNCTRIARYVVKHPPIFGILDEQQASVILQHLTTDNNVPNFTAKLIIRYYYDNELLTIRTVIDKDNVTVMSRKGASRSASDVVNMITDALVEHKAANLWYPIETSNSNICIYRIDTKNIQPKDILSLIDTTNFKEFSRIKVYLDYTYIEQ